MVETAFARLAVEPDADGNWTWTGNERDVDGNLTPKPPWHAETDADLYWLAAGELSERRKARRPVALEELELVARIYREHIDGQPVVEVQRVMGYTKRTAHRRVEQARAKHLLPPTTQGKRKA